MKRAYGRHLIDESTVSERFWPRVEKRANGKRCWRWVGGHSGNGRGYMGVKVNGRVKQVAAHRVSWELHSGPIPDNLDVLHHCDVLDCVRPDHLYLGTDPENARDASVRDRLNRKLGRRNVERARALYEQGGVTQRELARMFNMTQASMWKALKGLTYRDYSVKGSATPG